MYVPLLEIFIFSLIVLLVRELLFLFVLLLVRGADLLVPIGETTNFGPSNVLNSLFFGLSAVNDLWLSIQCLEGLGGGRESFELLLWYFQVNYYGFLNALIKEVAVASINEVCKLSLMFPIGFMNMPEDVHFWLDAEHCFHELLATNLLVLIGNVENTIGWPVSDQHISVHGNFIPHLLDDLAPVKVESPVMESGLPRTAIEFDSLNYNRLILQIVAILHPTLSLFRHILETQVVISTNDYFVFMRKRAKPFTEVSYLGLLALGGNVSGMHEDVAIGDY